MTKDKKEEVVSSEIIDYEVSADVDGDESHAFVTKPASCFC
jgi:hypothetical protein